jgi:hypothetical protein
MGTTKARSLPAPLEGLRRRFERWRQTRKARSPIPDPLWASAAKMAGRHGIHRTAKALRVNYYSLKKRVEQMAVAAAVPGEPAVTTFLQLAPAAPLGSYECTMELEDAEGAKMRVHLKT